MIDDLDDIAPENPETSVLRFIVVDYFATGEGRTVSILIARMQPKAEEWGREPVVEPRPNGSFEYLPGKLNCTPRDVLKRQFSDIFGDYLATGIEFLEWKDMKSQFETYLPSELIERVEKRDCELRFQTQLYINFN